MKRFLQPIQMRNLADPKYRPEIDGLRAIAVLIVLLFHLEIPGFSGGFIGVDVFFVISGYLITNQITYHHQSGFFSFKEFYLRRARRLLPALYFTIIICLVFSALLFSPNLMKAFSGSQISTVFSVSNFYFWYEGRDYFNVSASLKPLLHSWSLSVEGQFYFLWPALLIYVLLRLPMKWSITLLIGGCIFTFLFGETYIKKYPVEVFYFAPFRAFEFGIGALVVFIKPFKRFSFLYLDGLLVLGLIFVLLPAFLLSKNSTFPSWNALIPALGTGLIIYASSVSRLSNFLKNRFLSLLGLMSYSLYLIHWPVIVFYKYFKFSSLVMWEKISLSFLSVLLSYFMYQYVEKPFRFVPKNETVNRNRYFVFGCILFTIFATGLGIFGLKTSGFPQRLSSEKQAFFSAKEDFDNLCRLRIVELQGYNTCIINPHISRIIYVVGDSHAESLYTGFNYLKNEIPYQIRMIEIDGSIPFIGTKSSTNLLQDKSNFDKAFEYLTNVEAEEIILHGYFSLYWLTKKTNLDDEVNRSFVIAKNSKNKNDLTIEASQKTFLSSLIETLEFSKNHGLKIRILGPIPSLGIDLPTCMNSPSFLTKQRTKSDCIGIKQIEVSHRTDQTLSAIRKALTNYQSVQLFDAVPIFCPSRKMKYCLAMENGHFLYKDTDHLSKYGAAKVVEAMGYLNLSSEKKK